MKKYINEILIILALIPASAFSQECSISGTTATCEPGQSLPTGTSILDYDEITKNTYNDEEHGWPQYSNTNATPDPLNPGENVVLFKKLILNTSGDRADGFRTFNWGSNVRIDNLVVNTSGYSADGINLGRQGVYVTLKITGDVDITSQNGHGIRALVSDNATEEGIFSKRIITLEKSSKITTHGAGSLQSGYAVYAGIDESACGPLGLPLYTCRSKSSTAYIELLGGDDDLHTIVSTGNNGRGIFAGGKGNIVAKNIDVTTTGEKSIGIYAKRFNGTYYHTQNDRGTADYSGQVYLIGNTSVNSPGEGSYAFNVAGNSSNNGVDSIGKSTFIKSFNPYTNEYVTDKVYKINGDFLATNYGEIDLRMANGSGLNSKFEVANDGIINISIDGNKSFLNLRDASSLTKLSLTNNASLNISKNNLNITGSIENKSGIINISTNPTSESEFSFKDFTINGNYTGSELKNSENGRLIVNSLWNNDDSFYSDRLIINGSASGYTLVQTAKPIFGNVQLGDKEKYSGNVIEVTDTTLGNSKAFYGFSDTRGAKQAILVEKNTGQYAWYLPENSKTAPVKPVKPEAPGYALMPTLNMQQGFAMVTTLHERISDQHNSMQVQKQKNWGRWIGNTSHIEGKDRFEAKSNIWGFQIGRDIWNSNIAENKSEIYSGLMASYLHNSISLSDRKSVYFDENLGDYKNGHKSSGTAKSQSFAIGAYRTYYQKNGSYLDLVGNIDISSNDYESIRNIRSKNKSYGITVSAEIGKPYDLKSEFSGGDSWQIEPQAEIIYQFRRFTGFDTDHAVHISQENRQALRGRLGFRIAKINQPTEVNLQKINNFYITANLLNDFTISSKSTKFGTDRISEDVAKTFVEFGIGGQIPVSSSSYIYLDTRYLTSLKQSTGKADSYRLNIGFKHVW